MKIQFCSVGMIVTLIQFTGFSIALAQTAPAPAPAAASKADGPRIRFSETAFSFNTVKTSDVLKHDFIVTNVGSAVLEITEVKPGCGCTTAGSWDRQIQPGQTGKIPLQLNAASFSGSVTKHITITCNDPTQSTHTLQLQATVWRPFDVQPAYAYFMPIDGEVTNDTKVVRIVNHLPEPVTLEAPECANPAFRLDLKTRQPGKEFDLHVTYGGPVSNSTPNAVITIKTSTTNMPTLSITAAVFPQAPLLAMPAHITLPPGPLKSSHRQTQTIQNRSSKPVVLSDPAVNADGVTVTLAESQPGKTFTLDLNFPADFQVRGNQPLELTVKTTNPKYPLLKVPIIQPAPPTPAAAAVSKPVKVPAGAK